MITIISFGYGHAEPPAADRVADVRASLRNPFHDESLRELTGLDKPVRDHLTATPGAPALVVDLTATAAGLARVKSSVTIAIGCVGGRHRSVALAELVAGCLRGVGADVEVQHRDVDRPLLPPSAHQEGAR